MSIDTANRVINEQEEQISELENKILDREDQRDIQIARVLELHKAIRKIDLCETIEQARKIAQDSMKI